MCVGLLPMCFDSVYFFLAVVSSLRLPTMGLPMMCHFALHGPMHAAQICLDMPIFLALSQIFVALSPIFWLKKSAKDSQDCAVLRLS